MTDSDERGWAEAATVLDTVQERYEQADLLGQVLPDGYRAVEMPGGEDWIVEKETQYPPYWVPVAEFTDHDAAYEWAEELAGELGDEYRTVIPMHGKVAIERRITDD